MFVTRALESDVRELAGRANALTGRKQRLRRAIRAWRKDVLTGPAMLTWCAAAGAWWGTGRLNKRRSDDADASVQIGRVARAGLSGLLVFLRLARPVAQHLDSGFAPAVKDDSGARTYPE